MSYRQKCFLIFLLLTVLLMGCSPADRAELSTLFAPMAQTASAKGGSIAKTQASRLQATVEARLATEAAELKATVKAEAATRAAALVDTAQARLITEAVNQITQAPTTLPHLLGTARSRLATELAVRLPQAKTQAAIIAPTLEARLATEAAEKLTQVMQFNATGSALETQTTPDPPLYQTSLASLSQTMAAEWATAEAGLQSTPTPRQTIYPSNRSAILVYTVQPGDTLSSISNRLNIPSEVLLRFNVFRYPTLLQSPDTVQPGWMLVIGTQPPNLSIPWQPAGQPSWSSTPGCDVSWINWLSSPMACEAYQLDIVTKVIQDISCVSSSNLLGEQWVHTIYTGWVLTGADRIFSYGWFVDDRQGIILPGPAIVLTQTQFTECKPQ